MGGKCTPIEHPNDLAQEGVGERKFGAPPLFLSAQGSFRFHVTMEPPPLIIYGERFVRGVEGEKATRAALEQAEAICEDEAA